MANHDPTSTVKLDYLQYYKLLNIPLIVEVTIFERFIYLFDRVTERKEERQRQMAGWGGERNIYLPPTGLLPKQLQWSGLGQIEARS